MRTIQGSRKGALATFMNDDFDRACARADRAAERVMGISAVDRGKPAGLSRHNEFAANWQATPCDSEVGHLATVIALDLLRRGSDLLFVL